MDRRLFLSAAGAAATLHPTLLSRLSARDPAEQPRAASWIPSSDFLSRLPMLMRVASLPGLSMAVVERGAVIWTKSFGVLNADTKTPVRDDTLFEACSMSKAVFAYAVLQLVDQKQLDLDRPLVSYHKPAYLPDDPTIAQITARTRPDACHRNAELGR